MKKLIYTTGILFVLLLLSACTSTVEAEVEDSPPVEKEDAQDMQPEIFPITEAALYQLFEDAYTTCGSDQSRSDEQVSNELSVLEKRSTSGDAIWPLDWQDLYKSWRNEVLAAKEEALMAQLMAEYEEIIANRIRFDAEMDGFPEADGGLFFADYVDFDNDGIVELVLASMTDNRIYDESIAQMEVEIYGHSNGHVKQYGSLDEGWGPSGAIYIGLCKYGDNMGINTYHWGGGTGSPQYYSYYTVSDESLVTADEISFGRMDNPDEESDAPYIYVAFSFDNIITEEEAESIQEKYEDCASILSISESYPTALVNFERGILPELPDITVTVNGEAVELGADPFVQMGFIMTPVRPVLEAMGVAVYANSPLDTVLGSTKTHTLDIYDIARGEWRYGEFGMRFDGEDIPLRDNPSNKAVAPVLVDGQMFVPINAAAKLFGAQAEWDSATKTLAITGSIPLADQMSTDELKKMEGFTAEEALSIAEQQGYSFVSLEQSEWDFIPKFRSGRKYWWFAVLPNGVEPEYYYDEAYGMELISNDIIVEVSDRGEIIFE